METSKAQKVTTEISSLLRARTPLLWVVTSEEARVERYLFEACAAAGFQSYTWDCASGLLSQEQALQHMFRPGASDPIEVLDQIGSQDRNGGMRRAWIFRDLKPWIDGPIGMAACRKLRSLARKVPSAPRNNTQALIVLSVTADLPETLKGVATVIDFPLPDAVEMKSILEAALQALPADNRKFTDSERSEAVQAALGLSGDEAMACFAKMLVDKRKIDVALISNEKKRVIGKAKVIEFFNPIAGGLDAVGGLDVLKAWLLKRKNAFSQRAKEYGLPTPKGTLLVGVQGCGKSLLAKAVATAWGVPLVRVDLGGLKSKFVGESEQNIRKALKTIEAVGRCIVWIDEIEKALSGAVNGAADGGVSSDTLGTLLTWMQDRESECFVVATANDVSVLPPELLRKGRFDEIFFVDLPNAEERVQILGATLKAHNRAMAPSEIDYVARGCVDFTGSEVAALVGEAMFASFDDGERELNKNDLLAVAASIVPLAHTAKEKITRLRTWAKGRARRATTFLEPASDDAAEQTAVVA